MEEKLKTGLIFKKLESFQFYMEQRETILTDRSEQTM